MRVIGRNPAKLTIRHPDLETVTGSVTENLELDAVMSGVDSVVSMLGDAQAQRTRTVNTDFVREVMPAMRRHGVSRFLYQAGGLSAAPDAPLPPALRLLRSTIARGLMG